MTGYLGNEGERKTGTLESERDGLKRKVRHKRNDSGNGRGGQCLIGLIDRHATPKYAYAWLPTMDLTSVRASPGPKSKVGTPTQHGQGRGRERRQVVLLNSSQATHTRELPSYCSRTGNGGTDGQVRHLRDRYIGGRMAGKKGARTAEPLCAGGR